MQNAKRQVVVGYLSKECVAVKALAQHFNCPDSIEEVFQKVFDWYYVPRSDMRRAYAARVMRAVLRTVAEQKLTPDYPLWFWRVHELLITQCDTIGSVPPPTEP